MSSISHEDLSTFYAIDSDRVAIKLMSSSQMVLGCFYEKKSRRLHRCRQ